MAWERLKVSYLRKGWNLSKLKKEIEMGKIKVRTLDVGRPKRHYVHLFYTKGGKLVASTYGVFKRKHKK